MPLNIRVRIEGAREVIRAFDRLPPQAKIILEKKTLKISRRLAVKVRLAATGDSGQSALIAPSVRAVPGAQPQVTAGSGALVGRNSKPDTKIMFGSEFGAHTLRQFRPYVGNDGYWFFRTQKREQGAMNREWNEMSDELVHRWGA